MAAGAARTLPCRLLNWPVPESSPLLHALLLPAGQALGADIAWNFEVGGRAGVVVAVRKVISWNTRGPVRLHRERIRPPWGMPLRACLHFQTTDLLAPLAFSLRRSS